MAEEHIPAVAVAVAKDGRIVWEEGFGWANVARQVPTTPHTMFSVASVTKPMTATAVMRLVEEGRVHLDRPANDYLGDVKLRSGAWSPAGATVRRVLSHTAGLPFHYEWVYQGESHRARTGDEAIARYGVLVAPPGAVFQYSNIGYGVLGAILERVSGRRYADFMRAEVFRPLGMSHTVVSNGAELGDTAAVRYANEREAYPPYDLDTPAGGAVYSSVHDLVRFGMFHLGNRVAGQQRILRDSTRRAMQQPATSGLVGDQYGFGWLVDNHDGHLRVFHPGDMPGVRARLNLYPDENVVVAVIANQYTESVDRVADAVAAALLPRRAATQPGREARVAAGAAADAPFTAPPELLGEWAGQITTADGTTVPLILRVQPDGDVHVQLGDELRTLLNDISFEHGRLVGRFAGTMPGEDARRHPHSVLLTMWLRDGKLAGAATAQSDHFALSSYVELKKKSDTK
jgi:CubicO group peptidase (beta-lactamase class C family)